MTVYITKSCVSIHKVFADKKKAQAYVAMMLELYEEYLGIVEMDVE